MRHICRLSWRLFYLLLPALMWAQGPQLTTISDTVYRADGTPAQGTLLISWPEFTTAANQAVAAGSNAVILGTGGSLYVQLAPNAGATPANTVYTVVYQLDDGTVKTQYWSVPTNSPDTIAEVVTTLGAGLNTTQFASQQYVNTQLLPKANDNAVVHLSGTETVTGTKQFTVSPSFPTPQNSTDAANKQYVDTAVENSGSGNYVSIAGATMTGPLVLPGAPTSTNQAANKGYIDGSLADKADLVSGIVPTAELAAGVANNGVCLHGDSTWGGCGTSSNAVAIQSTPVATTPPTNNQVLTYVGSTGQYAPMPGGGLSAGMQAVKYATDFAWTQSPSANLVAPGAVTISLSACPAGVTATEPQYYVYIAGTGIPEAVLVSGGTCAGNGLPGTLQFTTANTHATGYTVASASGGLQEALIAARFVPTNPPGTPQSGKVIVPPGELTAYARVSIRAANITVDFSGSIVDCAMNDTCIFAGDPTNSNLFEDITLIAPRGRPMIVGGQKPFLEVDAQKTRIFNVSTRVGVAGGTFSSYVQVDDDQAFLLDGLDTSLGAVTGNSGVFCNATTCNPVVYAPGPFNVYSAVGWLKNLNISMQCTGNGIDWQSGNTLRVSDSVIQGYSQFGVRAGTKRGGYGGFALENVYEEVGGCPNPAGNIGQAGVIAQGATVRVYGGEGPSGTVPVFASTGATENHYYIVAHQTTYGPSNLLYAGKALTSGSGNITITTPDIAGATTFDLLRVPEPTNGALEQAPYGNGNYAVTAGIARTSACANGVCTFTDPQTPLQPYSVSVPTYYPMLDFWPGSIVLGGNQDSSSLFVAARAWTQTVPSDLVAIEGMSEPAVVSESCDAMASWTPAWLSCYTGMAPSSFFQQGALLLAVKPNQDAGEILNLKGRLNFSTLGTAPGHIITLSDSNFQKTIATANNRPSNDFNDAFIGYDQGDGNPAHIGIAMGAPVSLSNYIGNVGDGTSWLERLTSAQKEFKNNVQIDSNLTVAGTLQASSFVSSGSGAWNIVGGFAPLNPAPPGKSLIGFGTNGALQVSQNGGPIASVATLNGNGDVNSNAITATQLEVTPTQCNGSFATGIAANGNANCGTASVIQMAETTQPTGIPNYGLFWFDQTCHCPKVIDNNGQPVQLGLTNVFNTDANTLEEYNGLSPQAFTVYGTRSDSADYERLRLDFDTPDGYFFLGADALGTGVQRGLGFWLQGSLRWVIDTSFNLKPWSDNIKDLGTPTLRPKHVYAGTYVDATTGALATDLPNAATTGTTLNKLAKLSAGAAIIAATTDTGGILGVVIDNAGTSLSAQIAQSGQASCIFDGATTSGDYVQISASVAGDCHDNGPNYPAAGQVLGRVLSTNVAAGTYAMLVEGADLEPATGGSGSVNGQAIAPASVNNEIYIDGSTNTSPQSAYAANYSGQIIHWTNNPGVPVAVQGNAWGNISVLPAASISFGTTGCTSFVPNNSIISVKLLAFDRLADLGASTASANVATPSSGSNCLQITPTPSAPTFPGLYAFQVEACLGSNCSGYKLLSSAGTYGPLIGSLASLRTFDWSTTGPTAPPQNTAGLVVPGATIEFGDGPFLISTPQVPGSYSGARGYKRNVSVFQVGPGFPAGIPQLMEPWGQPVASTAGTIGQSITAVWGLIDQGSGAQQLVSVSEPHTFPAFISGYQAIQINGPGVPYDPISWSASVLYWGSSSATVGNRIAVKANSTNYAILQATTVGNSSTSQPNWTSVCTSLVVGATCPDGSQTWKILAIVSAYIPAATTYVLGSEVYDSSTNAFWESQQNISSAGTISFAGGLGNLISDSNGNKWQNIGLGNVLVGPLFGAYTASCVTGTSTTWSKQCAGGGSTAAPYLSQLKLNGSVSANWSGCDAKALCNQGSYTLTAVTATISSAGGGATLVSTPSPTNATCPSFGSGCLTSTNPVSFQIAAGTASGFASALGESIVIPTSGSALTIAMPTLAPPGAVGFGIFAAQSAQASPNLTQSGNNTLQTLDGLNAYCDTYVTSLPYGRLAAPGAHCTLTSIQTVYARPTATNASAIAFGLAGLPITGDWPGGAYGVDINNLTITGTQTPLTELPYAWGVFNMSAQEESNQNGTPNGGLQIDDFGSGCYYMYGPGAQDAGAGAINCTGQNFDYRVDFRAEDVPAFRAVMDISGSPPLYTPYDDRSCVQMKSNLVSTLAVTMAGEAVDHHCEAALEGIDVSNTSLRAANYYGRWGNSGRSPVIGVHFEPYTPDSEAEEILALGNGCNIMVDDISPLNCFTPSSDNSATGFLAIGDVAGNSDPNETVLTTMGGVASQFHDGATFGSTKQLSISSTGLLQAASPTFTGTPTAPTQSTGDNSTKLATTAYVRSESQMNFTCPIAGAGATVQYCNWTLPAAITVTGFDLAAATAPLTCSPYATMQVWDGTTAAQVGIFSITMLSNTNFYNQVTGSANVPATHLLRVKVTTAASGCGTTAAGIVATVTYQMQN